MKSNKIYRIEVIFSLLFFFTTSLFSQNFILNDDDLIDKRVKEKITQIGKEVKVKLGTNIYVYVKASLGLKNDINTKDKIAFIKNFESKIQKSLVKPYVLLTMSIEDMHVNLLKSKNLDVALDKDEILDGYVVPLLASKDKNTLFAKVSAAILNGYAAIADTLAEDKDIKLESSIGNAGKVSGTIWRVFMYTLVIIGLLLYTYAILRKRKNK